MGLVFEIQSPCPSLSNLRLHRKLLAIDTRSVANGFRLVAAGGSCVLVPERNSFHFYKTRLVYVQKIIAAEHFYRAVLLRFFAGSGNRNRNTRCFCHAG